MVALTKKKIKIFKGQTPVEEIAEAFVDELKGILEDAALRMHCDANQLKYRVDNTGQIEVSKMTEKEMVEMETERVRQKSIRAIRESRGLSNG